MKVKRMESWNVKGSSEGKKKRKGKKVGAISDMHLTTKNLFYSHFIFSFSVHSFILNWELFLISKKMKEKFEKEKKKNPWEFSFFTILCFIYSLYRKQLSKIFPPSLSLSFYFQFFITTKYNNIKLCDGRLLLLTSLS